MKAVILAGGLGSRLSEETTLRPKPMVEIGGRPILWHIMKTCAQFGISEFIICCGYKGYAVKEYFANYFLHQSDVTFSTARRTMATHSSTCEDWRVTLVDTGDQTMTGGRLKRVGAYLSAEPFLLTYGDGLSDVDIHTLYRHHRATDALVTVTAVSPPARFGALVVDQGRVTEFREKPPGETWINGGFFVVEPPALGYIDGDATIWEREPLERLALEGRLSAHTHRGFFQPMDTMRDKAVLQQLWASGRAPWAANWGAEAVQRPWQGI